MCLDEFRIEKRRGPDNLVSGLVRAYYAVVAIQSAPGGPPVVCCEFRTYASAFFYGVGIGLRPSWDTEVPTKHADGD